MPKIIYRYNGTVLRSGDDHFKACSLDDSVVFYDLARRDGPLGAGAYGKVYKVSVECDTVTYSGPELVIKISYAHKSSKLKSIKREAHFFKTVHGGPVFIGFNEETKQTYFVCKRFRGYTLKQWLNATNIHWLAKLKILELVFRTLEDQVHDKSVVHGDLNLNNILVRQVGLGQYEIKFIDFGSSYSIRGTAIVTTYAGGYWHPDRVLAAGESADSVTPSFSHDVYSLCYYLCVLSKQRDLFKPFLLGFCRRELDAVWQACLAVYKQYINELTKEVFAVERSLTPAEKDRFIQFAAMGDIEALSALLREKSDAFDGLSTANLSQVGWSRRYKESYELNVFSYCLELDHLADVRCKTVAELRAWLPEHLNRASEALLVKVKQQVNEKVAHGIRQVLLSDGVNAFAVTVEQLREKLPPGLRSIENSVIEGVIKQFRHEAVSGLYDSINYYASHNALLLLFAYGKENLQALLGFLPSCKQLAPTLLEEELDVVWGFVTSSFESNEMSAKQLVQASLALSEKPGEPQQLSGLSTHLLEGASTISPVVSVLNGKAKQLLVGVANSFFSEFKAFCIEKGYSEVVSYWQEQIDSLNEGCSVYEDWLDLKQRIQLSMLIVKGFSVYDEGPMTTKAAYRKYAVLTPEAHSLHELCQVVAKQRHWGSLNREAFVICVFDQQPVGDKSNPLIPLLQSGQLGDCFDHRYYKEAAGRPRGCFFRSADQVSRDRVLRAVVNFSKQSEPQVNTVAPQAC